MITLEDCIGMCGLTEEEVLAVAEHEHLPEVAATALAQYFLSRERGSEESRDMIVDDIREAQWNRNKEHVLTLLHVLHHFLSTHPEARPSEHPWSHRFSRERPRRQEAKSRPGSTAPRGVVAVRNGRALLAARLGANKHVLCGAIRAVEARCFGQGEAITDLGELGQSAPQIRTKRRRGVLGSGTGRRLFSRGDDHGFAPSRGLVKLANIATSLHLPVDAADHQLQVLADARSPAALQLLGYASAAQRAAGVSRLVPHSLLRLLRPEDRLALGEGDPRPVADRVRLFARERENVAQEGFDALVHRAFPAVPPVSLADSRSPSKALALAKLDHKETLGARILPCSIGLPRSAAGWIAAFCRCRPDGRP
jgi:hypothetical protein